MTSDEPRIPPPPPGLSLGDLLVTAIEMVSPTRHLDAPLGRPSWGDLERWAMHRHRGNGLVMEAVSILLDPSPWEDLHRELVSSLLLTLLREWQAQGGPAPAGPAAG